MIDLSRKQPAILFPGQGAQFVGMAGPLRRSAEAQALLARGERALGRPLLELIARGPTARLDETENTQPAVFLVGLAFLEAFRALARRLGVGPEPRAYGGHSLGQVTAFVAAGALDFDDGVRLVARRAALMAEAGRARPGLMAAVIGLEAERVAALCAEAGAPVGVANVNGPGQAVISGEPAAVEAVCRRAEAAGAKKTVPLRISIGAHSPLMRPAQDAFREFLRGVPIADAEAPVALNTTGELSASAADLRRELEDHLCGPVRWQACVDALARAGVDLFIDMGPGMVIEKLVRHQLPDRPAVSLGFVQPMERLIGPPAAGEGAPLAG